uniref:Uncharacterized protein n=1 Tax=Tanacetum cinerariifolium TaxID=118510 RepID=A0A699IX09_TANCI|nr:hypothetical protein [Tanacetum cinerariifolium]
MKGLKNEKNCKDKGCKQISPPYNLRQKPVMRTSKYDESNAIALEDLILLSWKLCQGGSSKLNLPDHRVLFMASSGSDQTWKARFKDEQATTTIANPNDLNISVPDQELEELTLHTSDKVKAVQRSMVATYGEHRCQDGLKPITTTTDSGKIVTTSHIDN